MRVNIDIIYCYVDNNKLKEQLNVTEKMFCSTDNVMNFS